MIERLAQTLAAVPKLEDIKRALFIQPHPDDNEIGAGGTIAWLRAHGAEVYALTVTDDRLDCDRTLFENNLSLRQRETLAAAECLGVQHAGFLGFSDKAEASAEEIAAKIVPIIRALRPDAVFSVDPTLTNECHRDHIKVGWAVRYAVMDAVCDFYPRLPDNARHPDTWQVSVLGQYFTAEPNTLLDIGPFWDDKLQAMNCHRSQMDPSLLLALDAQSRWFGQKAGTERAEALKLYSFLQLHCFNLPVSPAQ